VGTYIDDECMRTSYGVVWREGEEPLVAGKLELRPSGLRLDGLDGSRDIPYRLLAGVHVGRLAGERIDGRPSVVLERHTGGPIMISTVAKPSLVGEIVERLAALQLGEDLAQHVNHDWAEIFSNLAESGADAEDQLLRSHWLATCNADRRTWTGANSVKQRFARSEFVPTSLRLTADAEGAKDEAATLRRWKELQEGIAQYSKELKEASAYLRDSAAEDADYGAFGKEAAEVRRRSAALLRSGITAAYRPLFIAARLRHPRDGKRYAELVRLADAYSTRVLLIMQYRSNAGQSRLFSLANQLYNGASFDSVLDAFRRLLLEWAPDSHVEEVLLDTSKDWYNRRGHKYVLYEYELSLASGGALVPHFSTFTVGQDVPARTTEHIYPQTPLDPSWVEAFPEKTDQELRHSLGNLVLTLDNSAYSNKPFLEKRGKAQAACETPRTCYAQSSLKQERELAQFDEWTPTTIRDRQRTLAQFAMQRWHVSPPLGEADPVEAETGNPDYEDVIDPPESPDEADVEAATDGAVDVLGTRTIASSRRGRPAPSLASAVSWWRSLTPREQKIWGLWIEAAPNPVSAHHLVSELGLKSQREIPGILSWSGRKGVKAGFQVNWSFYYDPVSSAPMYGLRDVDGLSAVEYAALLDEARAASEESPANV